MATGPSGQLSNIAAELEAFEVARTADPTVAWRSLERAHILAQPYLRAHASVHRRMLGYAIERGEWRECLGQLFRLALVPLGNATGKLPLGNTGRANVSAFQPMPIPQDLLEAVTNPVRSLGGDAT
jgi:hypothetical protein